MKNSLFVSLLLLLHIMPNLAYGQCEGVASCVTNINNYKCINVGTATDLITLGKLLPYVATPPSSSPALTQPQKIVVINYIDFNTTYVFASGSEIILLPGAQLVINAKVAMNGITIRGCGGSWLKIDVGSTGQLTMIGTTISNSCEGIVLNSGARATIALNTFTDNYTCIQARGNVTLMKDGISHNTFDGTVNTNSGCSPLSRIAIRLNNVPYILIGNQPQNGITNIIKGYDAGIYAVNSNVDVVNTIFASGVVNGTAIWLSSNNGVYTASIVGKGKSTASPLFVSGYGIGISAKNYNLTVENARFSTSTNAIEIADAGTNAFATTLDINANRFENYISHAIVASSHPFTKANITNNDFIDDNPDGGWDYRAAIRWSNNTVTNTLVKPTIEMNHFYDNAKVSSSLKYKIYGVWATRPSNLVVHHNFFTQNYQSSVQHEYKGIWMVLGDHNEISDNVLNGAFGPATIGSGGIDYNYQGISVDNSTYNLFSCNQATNFNYGTYFNGISDHTDFKNSITSGNITGLYLAAGTAIGVQSEKQNVWPGDLPNDIAEAKFDGNPDQTALTGSQFRINSSNITSDYWPSPRIPGAGWFVPSGNEPGPQTDCAFSLTGPPKSERERQVIAGEFQAYKGYPGSTWEAKLDAFGTLAMHPELLTMGSSDAQFYNANNIGNIGKLSRALQSWNVIMQFGTTLGNNWNNNQVAITQKISDLAVQASLMEQAQTEAEQLQIAQTITGLQTQLQALQVTNQSYSAQYRSEVNTRANTLLSDVSGIATTEVWETNLKTVLLLFARRLLDGNLAWTASQQSTLQVIADQCRYEGAIGVMMARAAIGGVGYDDEAKCPGKDAHRDRSILTINLPALLTPNPATDHCLISFEQPIIGILLIHNSQGQVIQTVQVREENWVELDTQHWANGFYTVSIKDAQGRQFISKLAIIH